MAALEETLGAAIRKKTAELRDQRLRGVWIGAAAASYAADTLFLALFWLAGTISGALALGYGLGAAALSAGFYAAVASGWSLRLRDPGLVSWQTAAGLLMQAAVLGVAPQIAFPWLANLFTVFAFGMIWIPVASSVVLWLAGAALSGAFLYAYADRVALPSASIAELTLSWLYFSLVLGRCVFLSVYASGMRARLAESRRRLAESMAQIQELVSHDELTKALNRRALMNRLEQERARAERSGGTFSLALLDLDHFKAVNDTYGHAAGDEVLKEIARIVHDTMRETDVFGRYGGEEFMMILTATDPQAAHAALNRICRAIREHDWSGIASGLHMTLSAGLTGFRAGETLEQAIHRADRALYQAKDAGRDRVCVA